MARFALELFGGFQARSGQGHSIRLPRRKAQALLAYLALHPGQRFSRETLIALLWGDVPDEQARHSLRQALLDLRRALPPRSRTAILVEGDYIAVDPHGVEVDVTVFARLAAQGGRKAVERAAALYRGDLLAGITVREPAFEEWLRGERDRLRETGVRTLQKLLALQTADGELEPAVETAMRLLAIDPLNERAHRGLMQLYDRLGRRAAALRQYELCAELLRRELGVAPEPETRRLYETLKPAALANAGPPHSAASPTRPEPSPPGGGSIPLVGRHVQLDWLLSALKDADAGRGRLVVVSGEAGIGKSRLAQELDAESRARGFRPLFGRCYELTRILAFSPWVEALRGASNPEDPDLAAKLPLRWRLELSRLLPELGPPGQEPARALRGSPAALRSGDAAGGSSGIPPAAAPGAG